MEESFGLYFHIPYCKQACHYCDFHFSTNQKSKKELLKALEGEIHLRKGEWSFKTLHSIYFGGGTPSVLGPDELERLLDFAIKNFDLHEGAEITLEANPDDLSPQYLRDLKQIGINRLSLGVQTFSEYYLKWMNRAHSAEQALKAMEWVAESFTNYSMDLIYGLPEMEAADWSNQLDQALAFNPPHISAYSLTVEPNTALSHFIDKEVVAAPKEESALRDFEILCDRLLHKGYHHYELSNFGKPGFYALNNTAYWQGKPYMGVGPAAHSYSGKQRMWNVKSNPKYIRAINSGALPMEKETLSIRDRYNEKVMMGLRTQWGISLEELSLEYGNAYREYVLQQAREYLENGYLQLKNQTLTTSQKGKFLADGIASALFMVNLSETES